MDSLIAAAARALAVGDPLGALKRVALREDPQALALRGIAMAQLGDLARARALLRRARRAFGPHEALARARCTVAEAEIALAARDLGDRLEPLELARKTLEAHGDRLNAVHARTLAIRRAVLLGRFDEATRGLAEVEADVATLPAATRAVHALLSAHLALRQLQPKEARRSLQEASAAARASRIPALEAEVEEAWRTLARPAARLRARGDGRAVALDEVKAVLDAEDLFVVDACRHLVRDGQRLVSLATRPVLFALLHELALVWPADASREALVARAFGARRADDAHRARLRVELGRLRKLLGPVARLTATARGFALAPLTPHEVVVLERPVPVAEEHAAVLALLTDGEAWSTSALALALGTSQRTVQRALDGLAAAGKAQAFGRGRARRWSTPPLPGIATALLLPSPLSID